MKLRRLILARYGHLTEVAIAFPTTPGLHIVLGANEAGKSTALSAIGDCLFRFPHRTQYDFLHETRELRIGVTVQASSGRQATFFRRKGRKEDLFDEQDRPVPESAIATFLSGATRERFDRVFGLNGTELRQGGRAILQGGGEVGEAILGARTGRHGHRELAQQLDNEATKLFRKTGKAAFRDAADRFTQARHELHDRRIEPAAWKQARDERDVLERTRADNEKHAAVLHAERSRLHRIRRTTPARLALVRALDERRALGPVPNLPADAADQHRNAIAARDQAQRDLAREQGSLQTLQAEFAALPENPPILSLAEAIDALAADRQRIAGAIGDSDTQRHSAAQCAARIEEGGRQLGLSLDADAVIARIPSALDREKVNHALRRHARLSGQQTDAAERLADAEIHLAEATATLAALPRSEVPVDLRQAIEAVKAEGRLDAELADAESAARAAQADLAQGLAALPLWDRDAAALAATPIPLEADTQRLTERLKALSDDVSAIEVRLADHDRVLADYAAQAIADAAAGELPTVEAIEAARDRRDRGWALIQRTYVDGGAAISAEELQALGVGPDLPGQLAGLIQAADRLADRRAAEQERVVAVEQRRVAQIRQQASRVTDERLHAAAMARQQAAEADWHAMWQPAGIEPADPAAMREWLVMRTAVLADLKRLRDAERRLANVRGRHATAVADLTALLPDEAEAFGGSVAALLRAAERICRDREQAAERVAKARETAEAAASEHSKAQRAAARTGSDMASWREGWAAATAAVSLAADASPELAATALTLWDTIEKLAHDRREAAHRVDEMQAAINRFCIDMDVMVRRIAPDLVGVAALEAVVTLADRLAMARQDASRRAGLAAQIGGVRAAIESYGRQRQAALDSLDRLRGQAQAADNDVLRATIDRWAQHVAWSSQIAEREAELRGLDDGKTLADLAAEADGVDFDTLPARIAAVDAELDGIKDAEMASQERMVELRQALDGMEKGRDAAAAAQAMETALADIDDIAGRYVALRMANILLRAGIDRFRRQQQRPLLHRAGQIFARLTEGRYDRLGVDEEDGKEFVMACRPDGTECQADRLSEGTLDQLYLALRLAAIESDAQATEPLPFIGDDLLVNFDDRRARAAIRVLADFSNVTQVILFTHHGHIAEMAEPGLASVHPLAASVAVM